MVWVRHVCDVGRGVKIDVNTTPVVLVAGKNAANNNHISRIHTTTHIYYLGYRRR